MRKPCNNLVNFFITNLSSLLKNWNLKAIGQEADDELQRLFE